MMTPKSFFYDLEREYYSQKWPQEPKPYRHLHEYFRPWLDPEGVFGGKDVLDVGAGECATTRMVEECFSPRRIVAVELFPRRMEPAFRANQSGRIKFVAGDCFRLPFPDASFDVVMGTLILHQLPDLERALGEIRRVLRNNGRYVGWEPNPFNVVIFFRYLAKPHSANQYLFWPWRIRRSFGRCGFHVGIRYFYAKFPRVRSRFLGSCVGLTAQCR